MIAWIYIMSSCDHPECNPMRMWATGGAPVRCSRIKVAFYKCESVGCVRAAIFNVEGRAKGRFCAEHKLAHMVNVISKRCTFEGCESLQPGFGFKGGKALFCGKHKLEGMINLKDKMCAHEGCEGYAAYGVEKTEYCVNHKTDGMIDLKRKSALCEVEGCKITKSYGLKDAEATRCATHKLAGMISLKTRKTCEFTGCTVGPSFNLSGMQVGRFCSTHKLEGMIDVQSKRCAHTGCLVTVPAFGLVGELGTYCAEHKLPGMVNVKSKKCDHKGCDSINRQFDVAGGKGRFCAVHKVEGMVDVKSLLCTFAGCDVHASYGKPGLKRTHCAKHRLAGMIKRPHAPCANCEELAIWGHNWVPMHCEKHKVEGEMNLVERACVSCGLLYVLDANDKCENCNPQTRATVALAKQGALMDFLDGCALKGFSTDKIVDGGACGKERPDRVYDFGDKIVILECDEYQHRERACECEQTRMINIGQSFGGVPVYFIRWNPDEYKSPGLAESVNKRHKLVGALLGDIQKGLAVLPNALVSALYMYYDGWTSLAHEQWVILTPFLDPGTIS